MLSPFKLLFEGVFFWDSFVSTHGYPDILFLKLPIIFKIVILSKAIRRKGASMAGKLLKFLLAIILVLLGIWTIFLWWADLLVLLRGSIGLLLILAGIIAFAIALD